MPFLCQGGNHECQWGRGCGKNIYFTLRSKGRFHFPEWIRLRLVLPQPCTPDRVDVDDAGEGVTEILPGNTSLLHGTFPSGLFSHTALLSNHSFAHFPRINDHFLLYADDHRYDWTRKRGGIRSRKKLGRKFTTDEDL